MSLIALLVLGFAVVPAFAFAAMGWLALAGEADDLSQGGNGQIRQDVIARW